MKYPIYYVAPGSEAPMTLKTETEIVWLFRLYPSKNWEEEVKFRNYSKKFVTGRSYVVYTDLEGEYVGHKCLGGSDSNWEFEL